MDKNKDKKTKKQKTGRLCGFIGITLAALLTAGTFVCDALMTGKTLFSFVTTGNVMDRFDTVTAETSRTETETFFSQAADGFLTSVDQKYTSYTLNYCVNVRQSSTNGISYINAWKEVNAVVDVDYTVYTVAERYAEGLSYGRIVHEYVVFKTGANAGKAWGRKGYLDQSVSDSELLNKTDWEEVSGTLSNELSSVYSLLADATYGQYDVLNGQFAFTVTGENKSGSGFLKPGMTPTLEFSYVVDGKRKEIAHHVWQCSHLNATKATVPQSLLDVLGGEA